MNPLITSEASRLRKQTFLIAGVFWALVGAYLSTVEFLVTPFSLLSGLLFFVVGGFILSGFSQGFISYKLYQDHFSIEVTQPFSGKTIHRIYFSDIISLSKPIFSVRGYEIKVQGNCYMLPQFFEHSDQFIRKLTAFSNLGIEPKKATYRWKVLAVLVIGPLITHQVHIDYRPSIFAIGFVCVFSFLLAVVFRRYLCLKIHYFEKLGVDSSFYLAFTTSVILCCALNINRFALMRAHTDIPHLNFKRGETLIVDQRYKCTHCNFSIVAQDTVSFKSKGGPRLGRIIATGGQILPPYLILQEERALSSNENRIVPNGKVAIQVERDGSRVVIIDESNLTGKIL